MHFDSAFGYFLIPDTKTDNFTAHKIYSRSFSNTPRHDLQCNSRQVSLYFTTKQKDVERNVASSSTEIMT